jgi:hypothetical protein
MEVYEVIQNTLIPMYLAQQSRDDALHATKSNPNSTPIQLATSSSPSPHQRQNAFSHGRLVQAFRSTSSLPSYSSSSTAHSSFSSSSSSSIFRRRKVSAAKSPVIPQLPSPRSLDRSRSPSPPPSPPLTSSSSSNSQASMDPKGTPSSFGSGKMDCGRCGESYENGQQCGGCHNRFCASCSALSHLQNPCEVSGDVAHILSHPPTWLTVDLWRGNYGERERKERERERERKREKERRREMREMSPLQNPVSFIGD